MKKILLFGLLVLFISCNSEFDIELQEPKDPHVTIDNLGDVDPKLLIDKYYSELTELS